MALYKTLSIILDSWPLLLKGVLMTLQVSLGAVMIGLMGGLLFGILSCKKIKTPILGGFIDFYVLVFRSTPMYVQILITYFALPDLLGINLSPLCAGIVAMGLNSIAYIAETVRGGINSIPKGQWDACYVLGYSTPQALTHIIVPQTIKTILPSLMNEVIVFIKDTSMVSSIGLVEMTRVGMNLSAKTLDPLPVYSVIALMYLIMISGLSLLVKKLEKELKYDLH